MKTEKKLILFVEDDAQVVLTVGDRLRFEGFQVMPAYTAEEGLRLLKRSTPDLVILDIGMSGMNGRTFLDQVASFGAARPRILVFTARVHALEEFARHPAVDAALAKTSGPDELVREIRRLIETGTGAPATP